MPSAYKEEKGIHHKLLVLYGKKLAFFCWKISILLPPDLFICADHLLFHSSSFWTGKIGIQSGGASGEDKGTFTGILTGRDTKRKQVLELQVLPIQF